MDVKRVTAIRSRGRKQLFMQSKQVMRHSCSLITTRLSKSQLNIVFRFPLPNLFSRSLSYPILSSPQTPETNHLVTRRWQNATKKSILLEHPYTLFPFRAEPNKKVNHYSSFLPHGRNRDRYYLKLLKYASCSIKVIVSWYPALPPIGPHYSPVRTGTTAFK